MISERISAVKTQFNRDAKNYIAKHLTPEKIREKDRIIELIRAGNKFERVLDMGCGPGTITNYFLDVGQNIYGVDISEEMIEIAKTRAKENSDVRLHFDVGKAEKLNFPDNYFDLVVCLGVLRYISCWDAALKEIDRVLKPGGILVVSFYYRYSPHWFSMVFFYRPLLPFISIFKNRTYKELLLKYKAEPLPFSLGKFRRVFEATGFTFKNMLHFGFDLFPFNRLFPKLSRKIFLWTEKRCYKSNSFGWLGSICIVQGTKKEKNYSNLI